MNQEPVPACPNCGAGCYYCTYRAYPNRLMSERVPTRDDLPVDEWRRVLSRPLHKCACGEICWDCGEKKRSLGEPVRVGDLQPDDRYSFEPAGPFRYTLRSVASLPDGTCTVVRTGPENGYHPAGVETHMNTRRVVYRAVFPELCYPWGRP